MEIGGNDCFARREENDGVEMECEVEGIKQFYALEIAQEESSSESNLGYLLFQNKAK